MTTIVDHAPHCFSHYASGQRSAVSAIVNFIDGSKAACCALGGWEACASSSRRYGEDARRAADPSASNLPGWGVGPNTPISLRRQGDV